MSETNSCFYFFNHKIQFHLSFSYFNSRLVQRRCNINFKSWNIANQSGLLNRMRNVKSNPTPQVTTTHIDLGDHHYEPLLADRDTGDTEQPRLRSSHSNDMED